MKHVSIRLQYVILITASSDVLCRCQINHGDTKPGRKFSRTTAARRVIHIGLSVVCRQKPARRGEARRTCPRPPQRPALCIINALMPAAGRGQARGRSEEVCVVPASACTRIRSDFETNRGIGTAESQCAIYMRTQRSAIVAE